jgi:hypothetical protein
MPSRRLGWPWTHFQLEGTGPVIDDAVIIPNTPIDEVGAYLDTPGKLAAWFGATYDAERHTLTISRTPNDILIVAVSTELIDRARCHTLSGVTATGPLRGYLSLRTVACRVNSSGAATPGLGYGTEVWAHLELPRPTPRSVVGFLRHVVRSGNVHMRGELGT